MERVLIMGSIFLPGFVMDPLVSALADRAVTAEWVVPVGVGTADAAADSYVRAAERFGPTTVIAHSNAGNFVPAVTASTAVRRVVFMDAVVPPLRGGIWPVVPERMRDMLLPVARHDVLPPWTRWWSEEDVSDLFPDAATLARVDAAAPSIPTSYLSSRISAAADWSIGLDCRYVAFGNTYAREAATAVAAGWRTRTLELGHVGMLQDPAMVADAVIDT